MKITIEMACSINGIIADKNFRVDKIFDKTPLGKYNSITN